MGAKTKVSACFPFIHGHNVVEGHLKVHVNHVVRTGDRQHVVAHGVQVQQVDRQLKNQDFLNYSILLLFKILIPLEICYCICM